jgi:hypothetical protein
MYAAIIDWNKLWIIFYMASELLNYCKTEIEGFFPSKGFILWLQLKNISSRNV